MKNLLSILLLSATLLCPQALQAAKGGGSLDGGGADVIFLPNASDDRVRLADPWLKVEAPADATLCSEQVTMPEKLKNELKRIHDLFRIYGNDSNTKFIEERVLGPSIRYCLVDRLPERKSCQNRMDYNLPPGAQIQQVACTEGRYTWIVKNLLPQLSIRQQALIYVHEGLRRTNTSEGLIAQVTDGLAILLEQLNLQFAGTHSKINAALKETILEMNKAIVLAGISSIDPRSINLDEIEKINDKWKVSDGGGLIFNGATIAPTAYIGAGSAIKPEARIGEGSFIIGSDIKSGFTGRNAKIIASTVHLAGGTGDSVVIQNSNITLSALNVRTSDFSSAVQIQNNVAIINSFILWEETALQRYLKNRGLQSEESRRRTKFFPSIGANSFIQDSSIFAFSDFFKIGVDVKIVSSKIQDIALEDKAEVQNSTIASDGDLDGFISLGQDSKILNSTLSNVKGLLAIGKHVTLKDMLDANFKYSLTSAEETGFVALTLATYGLSAIVGALIGTTVTGRGDSIVILDDTVIDGGGKSICAEKSYIDYGNTTHVTKIRSLADLQERCRSK